MPTRNGEVMEDAPSSKASRTKANRVPKANSQFDIHVDEKREADTGPPNDHDLRYARILEAITKSALTTREEVVSSGKAITDQLDQTDKKLTEQIVQSDKKMDILIATRSHPSQS